MPYQNILNWLWTDSRMYVLVRNVIEREIKREKVQMKHLTYTWIAIGMWFLNIFPHCVVVDCLLLSPLRIYWLRKHLRYDAVCHHEKMWWLAPKVIIYKLRKPIGGFNCTFSLSISLSITLRTSKFRNQFTISSKYFDMVCYLKQETYCVPISFEVKQNDIWTDNIQLFEMPI